MFEQNKAKPKDDPELARSLLHSLAAEGLTIREDAKVLSMEADGDGVVLTVEEAGQTCRVPASHLRIATGRAPRTTARGIYAAGDVIDGPRFTHAGSYHAGIVVRNALLHRPSKLNYAALPWVT